jgi:membrane protein required for colicin V production
LNPVDLIFGFLLVYAMLRGYSKGLLGTVASYLAPVAAFMVAADWSDPMRDRLADLMPAPEFVLDMLAPLIVFVVVVAGVRLAAALLARLLGVGLSLPGRILAAVAGTFASALVLGSFVLVVHAIRPQEDAKANGEKDEPGQVLTSPFERLARDLDRRFSESLLAPPLAEMASAVINETLAYEKYSPVLSREEVEAAARSAAAAAAGAVGKLPAPARRDGK